MALCILRIATACIVFVTLLISTSAEGQEQEFPAPEGWAALEGGNASKAAAIFRGALDRSPRDPLLHFGAAQASLALGRTEAAISSLKRAVEHDPHFLYAMIQLAHVAYGAADLDLAIRMLEKAAALDPGSRAIADQLARWRNESAIHRRFEVVPGKRFHVRFEGATQKTLGDQVLTMLDEAYVSIGQALNIYPGLALEVILYSNEQFRDITRAPAWAGGGYDGRIRLPIGGTPSRTELRRVLRHEYLHAVVHHAAGRNAPAWIDEGMASYFESGDRTWARETLRWTGMRIRLEDLTEGFARLDGPMAVVAYAESLVAAELLCELLNPHVGPFLQLLGNGATVDEALSRHGIEPEAFHAEWRRRVELPADTLARSP